MGLLGERLEGGRRTVGEVGGGVRSQSRWQILLLPTIAPQLLHAPFLPPSSRSVGYGVLEQREGQLR